MKLLFLCFTLGVLLFDPLFAQDLRDGDIIFQRDDSRQATAISAATHSDYTHVGLIFIENGQPVVYEGVQPVRKTPLKEWIARGNDGAYVIKRLRDQKKVDSAKLKKEVTRQLGKDYDWLFDWSDDRIYCSELVWKAYQRSTGVEIGSLKKLGDFDLTSDIVKTIMAERYGKNPPLSMQVISPADLFASPLLHTVATK